MNDIEQIFNDINKEQKYATANLFLVNLGTIFNKAKKWRLIENNPTLVIDKHKMQADDLQESY
ncbi:putative integrase [Orientia tsutsugamushi str. Ikeda]|uniref:Putative integrase n=1 Tax=Orientia tsutsugamushi (strain Ikeda) TaxID=334380 RepID=B3CTE0_ORITI|nr:putative integrase [Orientia tsutsugamushi str. Ikeda]